MKAVCDANDAPNSHRSYATAGGRLRELWSQSREKESPLST